MQNVTITEEVHFESSQTPANLLDSASVIHTKLQMATSELNRDHLSKSLSWTLTRGSKNRNGDIAVHKLQLILIELGLFMA